MYNILLNHNCDNSQVVIQNTSLNFAASSLLSNILVVFFINTRGYSFVHWF